jgi:hypothetical protein
MGGRDQSARRPAVPLYAQFCGMPSSIVTSIHLGGKSGVGHRVQASGQQLIWLRTADVKTAVRAGRETANSRADFDSRNKTAWGDSAGGSF